MQTESCEEAALTWFTPQIGMYCAGRWQNIEPEDRFSEASSIFIQALRIFPWVGGVFWQNYLSILCPYMDDLNRATHSLRYPREVSLDKPYTTNHGETGVCLHNFVQGRGINHESMELRSFLNSLLADERRIVADLASGRPKHAVAAENGLTIHKLNRFLEGLEKRYHDADWIEPDA